VCSSDLPRFRGTDRPMTKIPVAGDVRRFILTSIPSVPYLEALLLLRSRPATAWDAGGVASRLYIGVNQATELLDAMQQAGIAVRNDDGGYTFSPRSEEVGRVIDDLAVTYSQDLVGVTELIHSRIDKRAHQFADAFRWKKDAS